jgi:hypothetical protein
MDGPLLVISMVSTVLPLAAVFYALRLAKFAGAKSTWLVIATVLALMVFHKATDLLRFFFPKAEILASEMISESIVLVTWFLMLVGTLFIANVFRSKVKAEQEFLRRNRELTALNAIAETVSHSLDLDLILNDAFTTGHFSKGLTHGMH